MNDFMDKVDAYAVESDFMRELNSILEDKPGDEIVEARKKESARPSPVDIQIKITPFDAKKYLQQSQDFLFIEANAAYGKSDYDKALSAFSKADE